MKPWSREGQGEGKVKREVSGIISLATFTSLPLSLLSLVFRLLGTGRKVVGGTFEVFNSVKINICRERKVISLSVCLRFHYLSTALSQSCLYIYASPIVPTS